MPLRNVSSSGVPATLLCSDETPEVSGYSVNWTYERKGTRWKPAMSAALPSDKPEQGMGSSSEGCVVERRNGRNNQGEFHLQLRFWHRLAVRPDLSLHSSEFYSLILQIPVSAHCVWDARTWSMIDTVLVPIQLSLNWLMPGFFDGKQQKPTGPLWETWREFQALERPQTSEFQKPR